jgi:hypothetical protein
MRIPPSDRLFLDAGYALARFNPRDQFHSVAVKLGPIVDESRELWTTDAVLLEICAGFSAPVERETAIILWDQFQSGDPRYRVAHAGPENLDRAMTLFRSRMDKAWSLTDCLSFVVMEQEALTDALTADQHFVQAGFRALMLEDD